MNSQDLQTIAQKKINVVIVLVNNNGYLAIRHTQKEFLKAKYLGTSAPDITFPNFEKLSKAYDLKYIKIKKDNDTDINETIKKINKINGPIVCELFTDPDSQSLFKQGYKRIENGTLAPMDLSEMFPFVKSPISNTNN